MDVLDLDEQYVARLRSFDFEGPGEIVDLGQVDILHVICTVVVLDLSARPIQAFDLDGLSVLDCAAERDWDRSQ